MTTKGRILLNGVPVTGLIEFVIREDETGRDSEWVGSFSPPSNFDFATSLPGGIGTLQLADGAETGIFLLSQEKDGRIAFHCPTAPKRS